ncbi:MAG: divalent-cation tolerance protein CutA [Verrucomicrobiota bacterium]
MKKLMIGWTTFANEDDAQTLGDRLVAEGLAACVQLDGPVKSTYRWMGKLTRETEYRLTVKFPKSHAADISAFIQQHHPYDNPQWLACRAREAAPAYVIWALSQTNPDGPAEKGV